MLRVYCDFDGTIVREDVGNRFFRAFAPADAERIVVGYLEGTMNARDCLTQECAAVPRMDRPTFERFADGFHVDPTFAPFVQWCRGQAVPVMVLSDGLDAYVGRILAGGGLSDLPFAANRAVFGEAGGVTKLSVEFPYRDEACELCGNCKRNHIVTTSGDDDVVVYVGDGISDRCPVRYADIVFARRSLIAYCQEQNITYHTFEDFAEVRWRLERLKLEKRLRQRREAAVARRAVFLQG
ncbi:MAG: HAD-IB family phosphatase [Bacteroidetes bacterium]|nr:HAD-IB family phosphatase [Bacteroidota bacterium]